MVRITSEHLKSMKSKRILVRLGSRGNSAILNPSIVKRPLLSGAPKACKLSITPPKVAIGGVLIKSKPRRC